MKKEKTMEDFARGYGSIEEPFDDIDKEKQKAIANGIKKELESLIVEVENRVSRINKLANWLLSEVQDE